MQRELNRFFATIHTVNSALFDSSRPFRMPAFIADNFIIVGITLAGRKFRPSDWAERLCGVMSAFGSQRRMTYSPYVQPGNLDGEKCVFVDGRIHDVEPMAYTFLVNFARDNQLRVQPWTSETK